KPAPAPAPAPSGGPFQVRFSSANKAKVMCGDGQQAEFVGATTLSFELRTSCRVKVGNAMTAFPVGKTASVTCTEADGNLTCSGY
ncbi:MAG TPA: hypothetical protein PLA94_32195, partial [Myxococcota bacterium]|nr:hypothetical protein [Myxococcota bacterium]